VKITDSGCRIRFSSACLNPPNGPLSGSGLSMKSMKRLTVSGFIFLGKIGGQRLNMPAPSPRMIRKGRSFYKLFREPEANMKSQGNSGWRQLHDFQEHTSQHDICRILRFSG